ncbi:hypothetical protein VPH35_013974 [Triticum aestivum]
MADPRAQRQQRGGSQSHAGGTGLRPRLQGSRQWRVKTRELWGRRQPVSNSLKVGPQRRSGGAPATNGSGPATAQGGTDSEGDDEVRRGRQRLGTVSRHGEETRRDTAAVA